MLTWFLKVFMMFSSLNLNIHSLNLQDSQLLLKCLWKSDISKLQDNEIEVSDVT